LRRCERGAADAYVQPPVDELLVLLGHAGLDLVDHQAGIAGLHLVQDLRHRVVAGVDDADAQRRDGACRIPCGFRGADRVRKNLPRLDQEHHPGGGQRDMVGAALQEADAQLALQSLHLLAQGRLDDVLALGRPAEVQFLGQRHEVAQLPKLHARHQVRIQPIPRLRSRHKPTSVPESQGPSRGRLAGVWLSVCGRAW
jgi:hypothetical protein